VSTTFAAGEPDPVARAVAHGVAGAAGAAAASALKVPALIGVLLGLIVHAALDEPLAEWLSRNGI